MKKVMLLASVLRKVGVGAPEEKKKGSNINSTIIIEIIVGVLLSGLFGWLGFIAPKFSMMFEDPRQIFQIFFAVGTLACLVLSFPPYMNTLYMSSDLGNLLVMPITPLEIVIARTINLLPMAYCYSVAAALPGIIGYTIAVGFDAGLVLAGLLAAILIPLIVLPALGVIIIVIMSFVKVIRNQDRLKTIGTIVIFALVVVYYLWDPTGKDGSGQMIAQMGKGLINLLPINFALGSIIKNLSILGILECLVITAALVALYILVAQKFYLNGAISMQTTSSGGKYLDTDALEKQCKKKSLAGTFFYKDIVSLRRNPAYLMNGFLYTIGGPILLAFVFFFRSSSGISLSSFVGGKPEMIYFAAVGVVILITSFTAGNNVIAPTSFSREGQSIMLIKQMPINMKDVIKGKLYVSLLICSLGSTVYVIIVGAILVAMGILPILALLAGLAANIGFIVAIVCTSMIKDLKNPNYDWENESAMIKKSQGAQIIIVVLVGMLVGIAMLIVPQILVALGVSLIIPLLITAAIVVFLVVIAIVQLKRLFA